MFGFLSDLFKSKTKREIFISQSALQKFTPEERIEIEETIKVVEEFEAFLDSFEERINDLPNQVIEMGKTDPDIQAMIDSFDFAMQCLHGADEVKIDKALYVLSDYHEFDDIAILGRLEQIAFSTMDLEARFAAMDWAGAIYRRRHPEGRRQFAKKLHDIVFSVGSSEQEKLIAYKCMCGFDTSSHISLNVFDNKLSPEDIDYPYVASWEKTIEELERRERQSWTAAS